VNLQLVRDFTAQTLTLGTLSIPVFDAPALVLQTLELPWLPAVGSPCGRPDLSCVPAGSYELALHDSPAHPHTFALVNPANGVYHNPGDVPNPPPFPLVRTDCLLHVANYVEQLEGCIGVGLGRGIRPTGEQMITMSANAFDELRSAVPWVEGHTLTISYAAGVVPSGLEVGS